MQYILFLPTLPKQDPPSLYSCAYKFPLNYTSKTCKCSRERKVYRKKKNILLKKEHNIYKVQKFDAVVAAAPKYVKKSRGVIEVAGAKIDVRHQPAASQHPNNHIHPSNHFVCKSDSVKCNNGLEKYVFNPRIFK